MNLVFLPATEPTDNTYGSIPQQIVGHPDGTLYPLYFPHLVWYNKPVRDQAIRQIEALQLSSFVLVGFSKSGLGAWNIARSIPDRVEATLIFDAPVARTEVPPWGTAGFYPNRETWLNDLPIRRVREFKTALPSRHRLILISGANFPDEMSALSQALTAANVEHIFLPRPHLIHHWNSGWIEEGLGVLTSHL
jgi:pimeloyl-ACP methyl ester carboxylesterase